MIRLLMRVLRLRRRGSRVRIGELRHPDEYDGMNKIDTNDKSHTTNLTMCLYVVWLREIY